jgi:hypothetical protein
MRPSALQTRARQPPQLSSPPRAAASPSSFGRGTNKNSSADCSPRKIDFFGSCFLLLVDSKASPLARVRVGDDLLEGGPDVGILGADLRTTNQHRRQTEEVSENYECGEFDRGERTVPPPRLACENCLLMSPMQKMAASVAMAHYEQKRQSARAVLMCATRVA